MSAANPKWARWIYATMAKYLGGVAEQNDFGLVIEALQERTTTQKRSTHKAEATIYGPHTRELSQGYHRINVEVFIVVSSDRQSQPNGYNHMDITGALQNALDQCIEVKEYEPGNLAPAHVGYLTPSTEANDEITLENLKPADTDQLLHSVLTAKYQGFFTQT